MDETAAIAELAPRGYDRDAVAAALGVCPTTLPRSFEEPLEEKPAPIDVITEGFELSDDEWALLRPLIPWHPVATGDRTFLDSVLWRERAKPSRRGWFYLPDGLGVIASVRGRFLRWAMLGHWDVINEAVQRMPELSERRKRDFAGIAADARAQREKNLKNRK